GSSGAAAPDFPRRFADVYVADFQRGCPLNSKAPASRGQPNRLFPLLASDPRQRAEVSLRFVSQVSYQKLEGRAQRRRGLSRCRGVSRACVLYQLSPATVLRSRTTRAGNLF